MDKPLNIIFPSCNHGIRKNSNKNRSAVEFYDGERLLDKQIKTIRNVYPEANITFILGFQADKVEQDILDLGCSVCHNFSFETKNVGFSISLGLNKIQESTLIIYGDLFFNDELLEYLPKTPSGNYLVKDVNGYFGKKEVGISSNKVLDYGFKEKWNQIVYLHEENIDDFCSLAMTSKNFRKFGFEIINQMVENGQEFDIVNASGRTFELDRVKDLYRANEWLERKNENSDN